MERKDFEKAGKPASSDYTLKWETEPKIGYAYQRPYPSDILAQLGVRDNKEYVSLTYVTLEETVDSMVNTNFVPILVRIYCVYVDGKVLKHDRKYITNTSHAPVDIRFTDEYAFNKVSRKIHRKNKEMTEITIDALLDECFDLHTLTRKLSARLRYRTAIAVTNEILPNLLKGVNYFLSWTVMFMSGREVKFTIKVPMFLPKHDESVESIDTSSRFGEITFLGYKTSLVPVFTYSLLHLAGYFLLTAFGVKPPLLVALFKNTFLNLVYVVTTLALYEKLIPMALLGLIKYLTKVRTDLINKSVEI